MIEVGSYVFTQLCMGKLFIVKKTLSWCRYMQEI